MTKAFEESLTLFKDKISDCIKSKKSISITTHIDCDGLTSGSIIAKALIREGARCTLRTSKEFSKDVVNSFKTDSRDFHIITDLGRRFWKRAKSNIRGRLGNFRPSPNLRRRERQSKYHKFMEIWN